PSKSFIAIPGKIPPSFLAFAELEPLTGASQTVLLTFLDSRVGCQQSILLQLLPPLDIALAEGARNTELHGAGLTVDTTAIDRREDVELLAGLRQQERTAHLHAQRVRREELVELAMVNGDGALAGAEENACGRCLSAACAVVFDACQAMRPRSSSVAVRYEDDRDRRRP